MSTHGIELGAKARDRVSGWEGTITSRYEYLNGCERYEISGSDKDGKPEGFVFDFQQIEVLEAPNPALLGMPAPLPNKAPPAPTPRFRRAGGPRGSAPVPR